MTAFLLKGLLLGFSIAAPVGPIGVLVIRRTLAGGRGLGLATGLGAAVADSLYGAAAAFGLGAVSGALLAVRTPLRLGGGLFLLWLGVKTFRAAPAAASAAAGGAKGLLGAFASTVLLTLSNPATILSFAAAFAGLGLGGAPEGRAAGAAMTLGVLLGSAAWWLILVAAVGALGPRFGDRERAWVNRLSGAVLAAFGASALAGAL